jgi:hypothetical protein
MRKSSKQKVDYVALRKPYINKRCLVESCTKHRNHSDNNGYTLTLSVEGHEELIENVFSFSKKKKGDFVKFDPQTASIVGTTSIASQKALHRETKGLSSCMVSVATLANVTPKDNPK